MRHRECFLRKSAGPTVLRARPNPPSPVPVGSERSALVRGNCSMIPRNSPCARELKHDSAQHHDAHQAEPDGSIWVLDCPDVSWLMLTRSVVSRTSGRQSIRASTERHARCWRLVTPSPPSIQSGLTRISQMSASGRGRSVSTAPFSRPSPSTRLVSPYACAGTRKVMLRWACLPRAPVPTCVFEWWASPKRLR